MMFASRMNFLVMNETYFQQEEESGNAIDQIEFAEADANQALRDTMSAVEMQYTASQAQLKDDTIVVELHKTRPVSIARVP